ncbi:MAG: tRNA 2-thiouridine(34) synthase MnmA [Proteobacteria bacterium]|nr:tRNA 2-thiouridine(34) synthase MnmA [Pseudomonadota bacterium]
MSRINSSVVVAMSGGVDSSVAAGLLVQQGYKVIGATLLFRPCDDDGSVSWCCGRGAEEQARAVAEKLGISHYVVDCAKEFENSVLRPAWNEYDRGRTPNPCVICNQSIKFKLLGELAKKLNITKVATGHYSRIEDDTSSGTPMLLRGKDTSKDQSYFLFSLSKQQMKSALFPLGELSKTEVRRIAAEMGFPNANRPESQDACLGLEDGGFAEGLRKMFRASTRPGHIVDKRGNELGEHAGIHQFTVGQRKGLGIAMGCRAYVANIDTDRSQVTLSPDIEDLTSDSLTASNVTWTGGVHPELPLCVKAQIRYRHLATEATIDFEDRDRVVVHFDKPQRAVAPGQAVVFYKGDRVLGGGWID